MPSASRLSRCRRTAAEVSPSRADRPAAVTGPFSRMSRAIRPGCQTPSHGVHPGSGQRSGTGQHSPRHHRCSAPHLPVPRISQHHCAVISSAPAIGSAHGLRHTTFASYNPPLGPYSPRATRLLVSFVRHVSICPAPWNDGAMTEGVSTSTAATTARRMWALFEPVHVISYFAPARAPGLRTGGPARLLARLLRRAGCTYRRSRRRARSSPRSSRSRPRWSPGRCPVSGT